MRTNVLVCVLVGLLVGAFAAEDSRERRQDGEPRPVDYQIGYRNGKEYLYEYDAQMATGMNDQTQNAITRLRTQLRLVFTAENTAVAQFRKIQVARFNDETPLDVMQMMNVQHFASVDIQKRHLDALEKPFEVRFDQGKVADLAFDQEDQTWSENVKRAAINHFQLQMDYDEPQMSWRVNETTIEGKCESSYSVDPRTPCSAIQNAHKTQNLADQKDEGECVQVTKSIDFDRCRQRPDLRYNFYRGEILRRQDGVEPSRRQQRAIEKSTMLQAELKRQEGEKYVLRFGRVISQYAQPLTQETSMVAVVVSEMKLKSIKKPANSQAPEMSKKSAKSLAHSLEFDRKREQFVENGNEDFLKDQPYLAERHVPEVIINIVKRLSQSFIADQKETQHLDWDGAQQFANLVKMIRYASEDELKKIEERLAPENAKNTSGMEWTRGSEEVIKKLLIDAYATAATHASIKRLYKKMGENEFTDFEMATAFEKIAASAPFVSQQLVKDMWSQCGKMQTGTQAQHTCVLSWSRLGRAMCARRSDAYTDDKQEQKQSKIVGDEWVAHKSEQEENSTPHCSSSVKNELASNLKKLFDDAKDDATQRLLSLKAYGNMGLDVSVQKLEEIIADRRNDRMTRTAAIDALRHLSAEMPVKVRRVLMPVFMDRFDFPEVRMNALHQLLIAHPDKGTIDQIGMAMLREPNAEVRSFAASALKDAAKVIEVFNPQYAQQCRATARLFKLSPIEQAEQTRRASSSWKAWGLPSMLGEGFVRTASLMGNDSRLPKEIMIAMDLAMNGHFVPSLTQWGVKQQNIEEMFGRALEKMGERQGEAEIFVRRNKRATTFERLVETPVQSLKSMYERLRIAARRSYSTITGARPEDKPQLMVYRRESGMDTFFALIDETHLPAPFKDFMMNGQIDLSSAETGGTQPLRWTDASLPVEQTVKIPTTAGLPLVATMSVAKMTAVSGQWSIEIGGNQESVDEARLSVRSMPKISARVVRQLEAYSPIHNVGVRTLHTLDAQAPIEVKATINNEGLALDWQLPDAPANGGPHRVLHLASHPSTLYRAWPVKSRVFVEAEERTLFVPQIQSSYTPVDRVVRCPLSGLRVEIRGHYHREGGINALMIGENVLDLHVHVDPKETAKTVRLTLAASAQSIDNADRQKMTTSTHLKRIFDDETRQRALFVDAAPAEISMLRERIERHEAHAAARYSLQARAQSLQRGNGDRRADYKLDVKARCDRDTTVCSAEAKLNAELPSSKKWEARTIAHVARPTLTGVHGSIRSEHVMAHIETEWGMQTAAKKEHPYRLRWNSLVNARAEDRRSNAGDYAQMEAEEYDRMILKQTPSRLSANRMTAVVEHQLTPETLKTVRPFVQYAKATFMPFRTLLTEMFAQQTSANEQTTDDKLHSMIKFDLIAEGPSVRMQLNDATRVHQMPSPWALLSGGDEQNEHQEATHQRMFEQNDSLFDSNNEQKEQQTGGSGRRRNGEQSGARGQSARFSFDQIGGGLQRGEAQCVLDDEFNIPMSTCYTVLAKDCGSSSPKFAVLAKKQSENSNDLKIKLIVPSKSFVLYQKDGKMTIEADGTKLREDELEQYSIYKISETGRPMYILHCKFTGMEVRFDGRQVLVKITDAYLNKQCGVCGHYNMNAEDTLRKGDNTIAGSLKEFHESYLYRGGDEERAECTPEALDKFREMKSEEYQQRSKFSRQSARSNGHSSSDELFDEMERKNKKMLESQEADEEQHSKKNGKKQRMHDSSEQKSNEKFGKNFVGERKSTLICFSIDPVRSCPPGTQPIVEDVWTERQAGEGELNAQPNGKPFVCMERGSRARSLMRRAQEDFVVEELKSMHSNKLIPVREAKKCERQQKAAFFDEW
ncbi:hypothetical protein M3Y99_00978200 [Aphelenchoides fujianensis]|nr:hypothetical protein M3Y99_00978200 [Aphelenchoides fujianensis]